MKKAIYKKGISLIVLVITIIVIIILAGSVILSLANNNPILKAQEAKFKTDIQAFNDSLSIWLSGEYVKATGILDVSTVNATKTTGTYNGQTIQQIIPTMSAEYADKLIIKEGKLVFSDTTDVQNKTWATEVGLSTTYPQANTAGTEAAPGTPLTVNATITGLSPTYKNPVIPAGFMAVNTTDANWGNLTTHYNKGLVIQDVSGNQFVWVPVDGVAVPFARWCTVNHSYLEPDIFDAPPPTGITVQEFDNNIKNVYGGFYIARYESMFDYNGGNIRAASKKSLNKTTTDWSTTRTVTYDKHIWNCINYDDAKLHAENMAEKYGYDTTKVDTSLMSGIEWDTTVKWLQTIGVNVNNGGTYGNFANSVAPANIAGYANLQVSGYSNIWKAGNVYDLSGNIWEWTTEDAPGGFVRRGGDFENLSADRPLTYRDILGRNYTYYFLGFRVALYVR